MAFSLNGSKDLTGNGCYNYLVNLAQILVDHADNRIQPVLFIGTDAASANIDPFAAIDGVEIVQSSHFNDTQKTKRLFDAVLTGNDRSVSRLFRKHGIEVIFESAQYYGWQFPFPSVAWIPDFQHKHLKELFSFREYWKRDLGFRAQILAGRCIMLSSEDSRNDCETFFPQSAGRTSVVHFAARPFAHRCDICPGKIVKSYGLPVDFFYLPNQFWRHKNHSAVLRALVLLKARGHDLVVATSGRPDDYRHPGHYQQLQTMAANLELRDNFRFLGLLPRDHVFALMRACRALINPSLCEGWSSTVEEAKSLGVPMMLSALPVHIEQAGALACYFDPQVPSQLADLMVNYQPLVSSPGDRELSVAAASLASAKRFAFEFVETVERAIALFEEARV